MYFHSNRATAEISPAAPKIEDFKNGAFQDCVNGGPLDFPTPPTALPPVGSAQRAGACRDLVDQLQFNQAVDKRFHVTQLADVLQHVSAFAAIIAWLLGSSLIGAEWRTGSMATLLTWEPRRIRVTMAKAFAAVVAAFIIVMLRSHAQQGLFASALSLILGGAVGNVIDRLRLGAVTDFLDFHWGDWHFATFNLADSAITVGVGFLLLDALLNRREKPY